MTAQGNPRVVFRRALERGNLLVAETTAREVGVIDLPEAPMHHVVYRSWALNPDGLFVRRRRDFVSSGLTRCLALDDRWLAGGAL